MDILEYVKHHINESAQLKNTLLDSLGLQIVNAAAMLSQTLLEGNKIFACGSGGSAAMADYFVTMMTNHFEVERPSLPAISLCANSVSLTAIANDYGLSDVYSRQLRSLGLPGDTLLILSIKGNAVELLRVVEAAQDRQIRVLALTGCEGGALSTLLGPDDMELRIPSFVSSRVREMHLLILHCLGGLIDQQLFPGHEGE